MKKDKILVKWSVTFAVLLIWTSLIIHGAMSAMAFSTNRDIYVQDLSDSPAKATKNKLIDYLFYHDFQIDDVTEEVPTSTCFLKAIGGESRLSSNILGERNRLSFHLDLPNAKLGSGAGTVLPDGKRIYFTFDIISSKQDLDMIHIVIDGNLHLKDTVLPLKNAYVTFDKNTNKVNLVSDDFVVEDMDADIISGCSSEVKDMYVLKDLGKRDKMRNIDEVRDLLEAYPQLLQNFAQLDTLFSKYWFLMLTSPTFVS